MNKEKIFLKNINDDWAKWCMEVGSSEDFNIGSVVWRYIDEGKDPMTIPCPPESEYVSWKKGLVGEYLSGEYSYSKISWHNQLIEMIKVYYLVKPILKDPDHLARIRRRLEDRLRTGANSGLGELIIMLAHELNINLE